MSDWQEERRMMKHKMTIHDLLLCTTPPWSGNACSVAAMHWKTSLNSAFIVYVSTPLMEHSGVYGLCIHSLLAQAGPIIQLSHAWDRPSVIQIVCTTYDSSTRKETWQPLISGELSVGQASWVTVSTEQASRGRGGWQEGKRRQGR